MERLTGLSQGSANTIVLDISGTPSFDLSDTEAYEGEELDGVKEAIASSMDENGMDGRIRDRGQVESVELMRLDLEGTKTMAASFTVLIQLIAAITIALSLQRLVQSQTREMSHPQDPWIAQEIDNVGVSDCSFSNRWIRLSNRIYSRSIWYERNARFL